MARILTAVELAQQTERLELIAERALLVRRLERISTAMRREPCEEAEEDDYPNRVPGVEPCYLDLDNPDRELCPACCKLVAESAELKPRLKAARRRLRYALDRIDKGERDAEEAR